MDLFRAADHLSCEEILNCDQQMCCPALICKYRNVFGAGWFLCVFCTHNGMTSATVSVSPYASFVSETASPILIEIRVSRKMIIGTQSPFCDVTLILSSILKTEVSGTSDMYLSRISSLLCPKAGAETFYAALPHICQITGCHNRALHTLNLGNVLCRALKRRILANFGS